MIAIHHVKQKDINRLVEMFGDEAEHADWVLNMLTDSPYFDQMPGQCGLVMAEVRLHERSQNA